MEELLLNVTEMKDMRPVALGNHFLNASHVPRCYTIVVEELAVEMGYERTSCCVFHMIVPQLPSLPCEGTFGSNFFVWKLLLEIFLKI